MESILTAGDTLDFLTTVGAYPPADGWTLGYRLVPIATTGTVITFNAATSGSDYRVQVGPAVTETWASGDYSWAAYVSKAGARYTVDEGFCTIKPDPGVAVAGTDTRSTARKIVAQLEAALETYTASSGHVAEYEINGRRMKFRDSSDLVAMLSRFRAEVWREDAAKAMAEGLPNPRNVGIRFARA